MAKRRKKRPLGEMESSDWTRGPHEFDLSREDLAKQDTATTVVLALGGVMLLAVILRGRA